MTDELLYDQRDGVGHIVFNRPRAPQRANLPDV
ncbi:MAG: hypothetical protein QOG73_103 [Acetobacteraceae bacterium]|nr:hypothetical protein [Acetobacteraceae bacterium]